MSRALNVDAAHDHVVATCARLKTPVSAIEPLLSGGTRVVMMNADDAALVAKSYGRKVMSGPVKRTLWVRNA
jgi:hypothetical protein